MEHNITRNKNLNTKLVWPLGVNEDCFDYKIFLSVTNKNTPRMLSYHRDLVQHTFIHLVFIVQFLNFRNCAQHWDTKQKQLLPTCVLEFIERFRKLKGNYRMT